MGEEGAILSASLITIILVQALVAGGMGAVNTNSPGHHEGICGSSDCLSGVGVLSAWSPPPDPRGNASREVRDGSLRGGTTHRLVSISPHEGDVVINEILYRQCGSGASPSTNNESVELYFREDADISGWKLTDGSESPGSFEFTFPAGSVFHKGDYVVVWIGNNGDAPWATAQFHVGVRRVLNNNGDDIWLLDSDGKVVDYVAYGSDGGIVDAPPTAIWDGNNAPAPSGYMQSISLTQNGKHSNSGLDWELTTTGAAVGPVTVDTDDYYCSGVGAKNSLGRSNNNLIDLMVKPWSSPPSSYVYDDVYEYPYSSQQVSGQVRVGETIPYSVRLEYELDTGSPTEPEEVMLRSSYSCPGWDVSFYDGSGPISLPATFNLNPAEPSRELRLLVTPHREGSCAIKLTLSYHDDGEGYDIPHDEVLVKIRTVRGGEEAARECRVWATLNVTDVMDGYPVEPGDILEYSLTVRSSCPEETRAESVLPLPDGVDLIRGSLRADSGEVTYLDAGRVVIWRGRIHQGKEVSIVFNATVRNAPLGSLLRTNASIRCLTPGCTAGGGWSDDPLTPPRYDSTIRPVTEIELTAVPDGEVRVPLDLSPYGRVKVALSPSCDGWNVTLNGKSLEEGVLTGPAGTLVMSAPSRVLAGVSCAVTFRPLRRIYWSMRMLGIHNLLVNVTVAPVVKLKGELRAVPKNLSRGGIVHLLITLRNEGNTELPVNFELPLKGLRVLNVLYHMGGKVRLDGVFRWSLDLPPWSVRRARVAVIAPMGGDIELRGELHYAFRNETFTLPTDDPDTPEAGDPTVIHIAPPSPRITLSASTNPGGPSSQSRSLETSISLPTGGGFTSSHSTMRESDSTSSRSRTVSRANRTGIQQRVRVSREPMDWSPLLALVLVGVIAWMAVSLSRRRARRRPFGS